jgi:predicted alpha/beta-fold hydrolase
MHAASLPTFRPHPLLRSGHAQTLAAGYWPHALPPYRAVQRLVGLDNGDQLVLHDDCPEEWRTGDRTVLLVHGLAGCHGSTYMRRIAHKLNRRTVRTFRMDLRGCGAGVGLARLPYHSGRSADCAAALEAIGAICPGSPCAIVGFSLGANIVLKLLGECGAAPPAGLDRGMAVSPPVDLVSCSLHLRRPQSRLYDRHFVSLLMARIAQRRRLLPEAPAPALARRPRTLYELDDQFTAPLWGFASADDYYRQSSSGPLLGAVRVPTLILAARDDPVIPDECYGALALSPAVSLHLLDHGGHLGFIGARSPDPDRRWLDWRVVQWATA